MFVDEPHGTIIRSNVSGMVRIKLRYGWVNLNNSTSVTSAELEPGEWAVTHRPQSVTENDARKVYGTAIVGTGTGNILDVDMSDSREEAAALVAEQTEKLSAYKREIPIRWAVAEITIVED